MSRWDQVHNLFERKSDVMGDAAIGPGEWREIRSGTNQLHVKVDAGTGARGLTFPAGVAHGFINVGTGLARHVAIATTAQVGIVIEELGRVGRERFPEILACYDSTLAENG